MLFIKVSIGHIVAEATPIVVPFKDVIFPPDDTSISKEAYLYCDEKNHSSIRGICTRIDHETRLVHVSVQWQTRIENAY